MAEEDNTRVLSFSLLLCFTIDASVMFKLLVQMKNKCVEKENVQIYMYNVKKSEFVWVVFRIRRRYKYKAMAMKQG
jgi:hypothetical protein